MTVNEYVDLIVRFARKYPGNDATKKEAERTMLFFSGAVEKYGVDPTLLTEQQLEEYYSDNTSLSRTSSMRKMERKIKSYVEWRIDNGMPTGDSILTVHPNVGNGLRKTMVGSPLHLQMILDAVFPDESLNTIDILYRAFLWLTFIGLSAERAFEVTKDDVDFSRMMVFSCGKSYPFCQEAAWSLWKACNLSEFEEINVLDDTNRTRRRVFRRVPGDTILRGKTNSTPEKYYSSMRTNVTKKFSIAEKTFESSGRSGLYFRITTSSVRTSGIFYRQYERERIGLKADFTPDAERIMSQASGANGADGKIRTKQRIRKDLEEDYPLWKQIYALDSDD